MQPKVFISHATEDKKRFVTSFATLLRENGVDAWLDQWEIKAGDSLVDKIFEVGLKEANAVIIVLSKTSVQKPWVREELNTSVVNKICRGTKLIPVIIDECDVPECLRSIVWHRVKNLDSYDQSLQAMLAAIFDIVDKPPVGEPPSCFSGPPSKILGLSRVEELVFVEIAKRQIGDNIAAVIVHDIRVKPIFADIPEDELLESLEILEQEGLIHARHSIGATTARLSNLGFEKYAESYIQDYQGILVHIIALIINEDVLQNDQLAARLGQPIAFVDFMLNHLQNSGHIKKGDYVGGLSRVWHISPSLRRLLSS